MLTTLAFGLLAWLSPSGIAAPQGDRALVDPTGTSDIRITVTELAPVALTAQSTLVIAARVVNASTQTLVDVGARLRVGVFPLITRSEVADFSRSAGLAEVGTVPVASLVDVTPELAPGQTADLRIEVPEADLGLLGGFGVHPLTLELRVAETAGVRRTAGSARTLVVRQVGDFSPSVRVAWIWPLVGTPGRAPNGVLPAGAATSLAKAVAPDGRLGRLLRAGVGRPVTWLVDGALLSDVHSLATGNGLAPDQQPDPAAGTWLQSLAVERGRPGTDLSALPFADPDLVASQRAGLLNLATAQAKGVDTTSMLLGAPVPPSPRWPGGGMINRATLSQVDLAGARRVLISSDDLAPQTDLAATPDAFTQLPAFPNVTAVTVDAGLSAILAAGPNKLGGTVLARQRLLAEAAMIAAERPSDPRSVIGAPPRRWKAPADWAAAVADLTAPWIAPVTVDQLAREPGDSPPRILGPYPPAARAAEVSQRQLRTVATDVQRLKQFAPAVADPEAFLAGYSSSVLSTQSTAWRSKGRAGRAYTSVLTKDVTDTVTSVRLLERGQVTLSSRAGIIPLAVENGLDQDVQIRVKLVSSPSVRLRSPPSALVTVPAGRTASVDVPAVATADATFPVVATLITDQGGALGEPVTFTVRATGYGQVARVVVGGALVLLAFAVVLRVARRIRAARGANGETLEP